jgi:sporulation integral membrane protein YlbJ
MWIKQILVLAGVLAAACSLLIFPAAATQGARNGIGYCLQVLVPSLYPFMVLSVFVVKCGLSEKLGKLFEAPARAILKLPGSTAATILMGAIGGYPTGARSVAALFESGAISENQAARMLCFCVNAGPAFVISAVGAGFLKSPQAGLILFASQLLGSTILSIISGITAKREPVAPIQKKSRKIKMSDALIASAYDAARAMLNMCCFVILFASLINLLRLWVTEPRSATVLSALLEVTGGCSDLAKTGAPLAAISFAMGWGGICVHFQVLSSVSGIRVNLARFLWYRLLHGGLSALITIGLVEKFPLSTSVFCNISSPLNAQFSGSVPAAAALIGLCAVFLLSLSQERLEFEES